MAQINTICEEMGTWLLKLFPFYSVPAFKKPSGDLIYAP